MELQELLKIMEALRAGCPWDKKQTRQSLKPFLVEETYEVLEAIEEDDPKKIQEELGDLLFQIVFHCRIAEEQGEFDMQDVIEGIAAKMTSRHPHVFADAHFKTPEEVTINWERQKQLEGKHRDSILQGVPQAMPSLLRAHRLQSRAAKAGFDWKKTEHVLEKLDEELAEFKEALRDKDRAAVQDELGDIFFSLVNVSRFVDVNPEDALRGTISKFIHRFRHMEMKAAEAGQALPDMSLEELDALWDEAKDS